MALQFSNWLVEHDAYVDGAFEKHYVVAHKEDHALSIVRSKAPNLDWESGRFTIRITWLGVVK